MQIKNVQPARGRKKGCSLSSGGFEYSDYFRTKYAIGASIIGRIESFWTKFKINTETGCWDWIAAIGAGGRYGMMKGLEGRVGYAHRLSYEIHKGEIGTNLTIDHTCCNTRCVNPDHLETVSARENLRRARARKATTHKKS